MALTDSQTILLMTSATFFRRIQIAAIRVSATVRDEVVDGVEMPLERHNARFGLASRFQSNSFSMAQTFAPSVAVALSDFLDWPTGEPDNQDAAAYVALSIPATTLEEVLVSNIDFIAGWDATKHIWEVANP